MIFWLHGQRIWPKRNGIRSRRAKDDAKRIMRERERERERERYKVLALFLLVLAERQRVVAAAQGARALRQHLLAAFGQFRLVLLQFLFGLVQLALLLGVLLLQPVETRLQLRRSPVTNRNGTVRTKGSSVFHHFLR